jgi:hypothetical protein
MLHVAHPQGEIVGVNAESETLLNHQGQSESSAQVLSRTVLLSMFLLADQRHCPSLYYYK